MASKVRAVGISKRGILPFGKSATGLMVSAARNALKSAGVGAGAIDLLINVGMYREENIGEPAIASFIQGNLEANPLAEGDRSTFAFDILDGGCGTATAIDVARSHLSLKGEGLAMIVAADVEPISGYTEGFSFDPVGAAILLEWERGDAGFRDLDFQFYPEHRDLYKVEMEFNEGRTKGKKKGNILYLQERPGYLGACTGSAVSSIGSFLRKHRLEMDDIDMIVPSQSPVGFPASLRKALAIDEGKVVDVTGTYGNVHTAGSIAAFGSLMEKRAIKEGMRILLLNVGSGIKVGLGLYLP